MSVLLHFSDTHFGTEQPAVLDALVALVRREAVQIAVWSGDITQRARRGQFAAARAFADRLALPHLLVVPGNHDIPLFNLCARVVAPYAGFSAAFGDELEPELSLPDVLVLCLNTTRPWRHKHGVLSRAQIERAAARLRAAAPGQLRIVVVHQPLCAAAANRGDLLRGHREALAQWSAAGVDLILGGHVHLPYVCELATPGGRVRVVQAGTAVSRRLREDLPNSVNLIRNRGGRDAVIERWDYDAATRRFRSATPTVLTVVDR